ncbi:MAG: S-layer homology domain-containing protein [Oscillospiraceae bacterium]|nr:S-layer homology domain-containing protein [Oscillospiraceae bacterium]
MRSSMKKAAALALSACLLVGSAQAVKASDFSDLKSNHWAYSYIDKAAGDGLVSGMGNGKFGPEEKLSNAQFITMVCNLLYEDNVKSFPSGSGANWWLPYLNAAQSVGILNNTTIASERSAAGAWTAKMANAEINRYDMAQIMMNVAKEEDWTPATSSQISTAQSQIADWSSIPSKYQNAVASAYAKKYLSGMDSKGTFLGTATMNRAQGAVVLCKLSDENESEQTPTYTNTTNLVNGKTPTAANVSAALNALRLEYPQGDKWNMNKAYESGQLGTSIGSEAFANLLSDRVFGNLKATRHTNSAALKVGDIVHMSKTGLYGVVTDVDDEMFDYVGCSETGSVTWRGTAWLSDLTSRDSITTRYGSTTVDNALANGLAPTESNVSKALWNLNGSYYDGSLWSANDRYTSKVLGTGYGSRGLSYYFSDEVFGDLKAVEHYRPNDLRVGDVFRMGNQNDDTAYGIVVEVNKTQGTFRYANVYNNTVRWDNSAKLTDLNGYPIYSRYPNTTPSTNTSGKLTNNTDATEPNVRSLISTLQSRYPANSYDWRTNTAFTTSGNRLQYRSSVLGTAYDSQALAYYLSDQIFGNLNYSRYTNNGQYNLRVGDVVIFDNNNNAGLVTSVSSNNSFTYTTLYYSTGTWYTATANWNQSGNLSNYTSGSVSIYSRYPSYNNGTGNYNNAASGTLVNGTQPTEANVGTALSNFQRSSSYPSNGFWGSNYSYRSNILGSSSTPSQALAYRMSDEVFGNLPVTSYSSLYSYTPRTGDVVRFNNGDYGILTGSYSNGGFTYLTLDSLGYARSNSWTNSSLNPSITSIQTRYPTGNNSGNGNYNNAASGTLVNGTQPNEANVNTALSNFQRSNNYPANGYFGPNYSYRSNVLGSGSTPSQAMAYRVSDEVFGNLPVTSYSNTYNYLPRTGDVVRFNDGTSGILTNSYSNGGFNYLALDGQGYARNNTWSNTGFYPTITSVQTRYPSNTNVSGTTLANGLPATESNIRSVLTSQLGSSYFYDGYNWNQSLNYNYVSNAFGGGTSSTARSFAHYISDQIFGQNRNYATRQTNPNNLKVGDMIETSSLYDLSYQIVTDVNHNNNLYSYAFVDNAGYVRWNGQSASISSLNNNYTTIWTRY